MNRKFTQTPYQCFGILLNAFSFQLMALNKHNLLSTARHTIAEVGSLPLESARSLP
jgi:hypothetical protein